MSDQQDGWVPRPHPRAVLHTRTRRRNVTVLTGVLGKVTVWLRSDGTFVKQHADGHYTTGRWAS